MPDTQNEGITIKGVEINPILEMATEVMKLIREILAKKNKDYTGTRGAFGNFEFSAQNANTSVEQGMIIRMSDKFARLCNLINNVAHVNEETIEDTARDLIGYLIIFLAYRRQQVLNSSAKAIASKMDNAYGKFDSSQLSSSK